MTIEESSSGGKTVYTLSDDVLAVEVVVMDDLVTLRSEDVNFVKTAKRHADGFQPTPAEFVDAVESRLDLALDHVEMADVTQHEATLAVDDGSIIMAGQRWGELRELYPGEQ